MSTDSRPEKWSAVASFFRRLEDDVGGQRGVRNRMHAGSLERRVFLVAVASLAPLAVLSCATLISNALDQKERLLRAKQDTALAIITAIDAELQSTIGALDAFAASPRLAADDFPALHVEAQDLLERRPTWMNVVVSDTSAHHIMNARLPLNAPLPRRIDVETVRATAASARPAVASLMYSPVRKTHGFAVQAPYVRDGYVKYVLTAVIKPDSLLGLLGRQNIPEQGAIEIIDRDYNLVARSMNHAAWVGKLPSENLLQALQSKTERGWTKSKSFEGVPVYTVFHRSTFSGWSAAVGIPRSLVDGPMTTAYLLIFGAIVLSVLLGLAAALLVGRTIVQPMRDLEASAARVGRGEPPVEPASGLNEIRRIGVALRLAHAEREELFQREREARIAAEQASRAKDEFLAMLGHELRNPLAALTTASFVLERGRQSLTPTLAHATSVVDRQVKHLSRLTDDLLDAGRVMLGKISLSCAPVDLAVAVQSTLEGLRSAGRFALHQVEVHLESVWVSADTTRLDQIVSNLLTNALKYTPAGGAITVSVRRQRNRALFEVSDTGIGIDRELLPRVFELFVQGERTLDRAQGGLGIGLTLVQRLTELHEGEVRADSPGLGQGATFTVELPAIETPLSVPAPVREPAARRPLCIAVIEDNDDVRTSMRTVLEMEGHAVCESAHGVSGLDLLLNSDNIDLALVDIGLPGMDGYALARAVRSRGRSDLYLVAMSGYGGELDKARGIEAGFDAYLVKPVKATQLHSLIEALPSRSGVLVHNPQPSLQID